MTDIDTLLRHTIKTLQNSDIIDWNSENAKSLKRIYEDYFIDKNKNFIVCPNCEKKTYSTLNEKTTKKIIFNYCDSCIMLFK